MVVGRIQFLGGSQTDGLRFLLTVSWRLPSVSCHMALSIGSSKHRATQFFGASKGENLLARWSYVLWPLTFCNFGHIWLVKSKSHVLSTLNGKKLLHGMNTRKGESWGPPESLSAIVAKRMQRYEINRASINIVTLQTVRVAHLSRHKFNFMQVSTTPRKQSGFFFCFVFN